MCSTNFPSAHNRKPRFSSGRFPMRQRAERQNGEKSSLCGGVNHRAQGSRHRSGAGLGPAYDLLSISTAAWATSAHDESSGVAGCRRPLTHRCGQTVQDSGQCHRHDLETAHGRGTELSSSETSGVDGRSLSRSGICGWKTIEN